MTKGLWALVTRELLVQAAVAEAFGDRIDAHADAIGELLDRERDARDSLNANGELTSAGKQARRRERFKAAISSLDGLLARHRRPLDDAVSSARAGLPGPQVRPVDNLAEGWERESWLRIMQWERERLERMNPLEAVAAIE